VAAAVFRQARHSIRISQMDFGLLWEGTNHWSADVMAAIVDVLTDPERTVEVSLVLSECGAKTATSGPYSFGTTIPDVIAELRRGIRSRSMTGRMRIAPLRIAPHGDRWVHGEQSLAFANHAKVWIVDDRVFHVGSDNLYPHVLQEFGYVVESAAVTQGLLDDYWTPLWTYSARAGIELTMPSQPEGC
jgi:hypothetical protein